MIVKMQFIIVPIVGVNWEKRNSFLNDIIIHLKILSFDIVI